jgi:hypothetical protein
MHVIIALFGLGLTVYCFKVIHNFLLGKGPDGYLLSFVAMVGEAIGMTMVGYGVGLA